ncbi:sensor histidine kinase [Zeaxanthinibacter enoshimensis]|uniref:sensor histidine kinase n=1 Tax=Zeaxanthinibacter enoshimensis TaxID=392009 RepID=UPI001414F519|nr:ATP-binding protein [Zeaxanthinibacter enoshimensis]
MGNELEHSGLMSANSYQEAVFQSLAGAFTHFMLEWSAVAVAFATAILAFIQFRITGNLATPIIGMALLCAGFMDAFHALASTQLIKSVADNENFIPLTWAVSRMFNALILLAVTLFILIRIKPTGNLRKRHNTVVITNIILLLISYIVVRLCARSENLPSTMFPEDIITRPYDVVPLLLFIILGLVIFPRFYRRERNVFSHALIWSMVPAVATQLHMSFGSARLFDAHFNIGHYLKVIFYLVPFTGMLIDYLITYREEKKRLALLAVAHRELERKNKELEQFVYIASHDLQEPLRTVMNFTELLHQDYGERLDDTANTYMNFIQKASSRMSALIKGLLDYSRIGAAKKRKTVNLTTLINSVIEDLNASIKETGAVIELSQMPSLPVFETELRLLFQNLLTNAIKFRKKDIPPHIRINSREKDDSVVITISDNGIGIAKEHQEKIFSIFKRLHGNDEIEGTGIGLAHCQKIMNLHGGQIWVTSEKGQGSSFNILIPLNHDEESE